MRIPPERVKQLLVEARTFGRGGERKAITQLTNKLRRDIQAGIDQHMQAWMVLLDEAVRFFIHFEQFQYSRELSKGTSPFAMQVSKARGTLISIRELVAIGQESSARALARVFIEDIELCIAFADDPIFAEAYFEAEDGEDFWKKNVGYGRLKHRVEQFISRGSGSDEICASYIARHREIKNHFSQNIHGSASAMLRAAFAPSLVHPGMLYAPIIGALSTELPHLCHLVSYEVHIFAACCVNAFIRPSPPAAFANYEPGKKLNDFLIPSFVLQALLLEYSDELVQRQDEITRDSIGHAPT